MHRDCSLATGPAAWTGLFRAYSLLALLLLAPSVPSGSSQADAAKPREVVPGIHTTRPIPGAPFDLLGNRLVFTNWYYIQPGDLDWINDEGTSVYVQGNEDPDAAHFVGKCAPYGIRLVARKPEIMNPCDRPHRCIIQDGDCYRGWTDNEYLESTDGIHWRKLANLKLDKEEDGIAHVFIDPSSTAANRFKAVWNGHLTKEEFTKYRDQRPDGWEPRALLHYLENGNVTCLRGSVSPDGITWTTLPEPLVVEYADTLNTAYYDPRIDKYVLYTRFWSIGPRSQRLPSDIRHSWTGVGRRAIGRSESDNFCSFPPSELVVDPPPDILPSEVLYTNSYTTIPGAPDHHLMFPAIWNASRTDATRVVMLSSGDGINWHWVPAGELFATASFGQWDGGCVWAQPNLIELPNGDWALPMSAHNVPHKYPRGHRKGALSYAVWRRGRMVALEAAEVGEFWTVPFLPPGRTLRINARTMRTGHVKVEVSGMNDRSLTKCDRLFGDRHWTTVTWNGQSDLGFKEGNPITLHFALYQAELYGLEFQ